jgi:hypothetical protein
MLYTSNFYKLILIHNLPRQYARLIRFIPAIQRDRESWQQTYTYRLFRIAGG